MLFISVETLELDCWLLPKGLLGFGWDCTGCEDEFQQTDMSPPGTPAIREHGTTPHSLMSLPGDFQASQKGGFPLPLSSRF